MIPGSASQFFLGASQAAGGATGFQVSRSLRFNASDSAYLSRTPAVAGNRKTWSWAGWVKRSSLAETTVFASGTDTNNISGIYLPGTGRLWYYEYVSGSYLTKVESQAIFRDFSAWYHILAAIDTTQATASNRVSLYVNGVKLEEFATSTYPSSNFDTLVNAATVTHTINRESIFYPNYGDCYLADIHFIDGQALTPSSFTEVSATTGQLIPKAYSGGSYGTNGFYLQFADNSSNTATTLGKDTSGNSNNWTPNNFQATVQTGRLYAQASGTATSAFSSATLLGNFPATVGGSYAIYDADLITSTTSATFSYLYSFSSVVEVLVSADGTNWTSKGNQSSSYTTVTHTSAFRYVRWFYSTFNFGITNNPAQNDSLVDTPTSYGTDTGVGGEVRGNYATLNPLDTLSGATLSNGNLDLATPTSGYGTSRGTIAVSSGKFYWEILINSVSPDTANADPIIGIWSASKTLTANWTGGTADSYGYQAATGNKVNNAIFTSYGVSFTAGDIISVALNLDAGTLVFYKNGSSQGTAFSSLSGTFVASAGDSGSSGSCSLTANFGQRPFAYTAPSGFKALCDTNLPAPVVAKPNTLMDVKLWTGDGSSTRAITGLEFNPDFVWIKNRNQAGVYHNLFDKVRDSGKTLFSNTTDSEVTNSAYGYLSSFDSNGFSLSAGGSGSDNVNVNNWTYAAWCWDAGTTTVSNTQGSITSQVRANASAGFSVVTYTGSGSAATVGHGLGAVPGLIIAKDRTSGSYNWQVYHRTFAGTSNTIVLNSTSAVDTGGGGVWNSTTPTSTVFSIGTSVGVNTNGNNYVAYCFAPVAGYSSFGVVTATGTTDGGFAYTGFRPRFLLYKNATSTGNWGIYDTARNPGNVCGNLLMPSSSSAEFTSIEFDLLSNGIKLRYAYTNGDQLVFAAFAESPFQYARAR